MSVFGRESEGDLLLKADLWCFKGGGCNSGTVSPNSERPDTRWLVREVRWLVIHALASAGIGGSAEVGWLTKELELGSCQTIGSFDALANRSSLLGDDSPATAAAVF